jgi:ribosome-interacting GTPase 1
MPTNLPPEAVEAERQYREAKTVPERIACLEKFISAIPKHKGTDKLRADLSRRLSKLKSSAQSKKQVGRQESVFHINKEGAGQVAVVGSTNVGKSALVAALTNATPAVADGPYTTWAPTPGMMPLENIQIQLIDTPPLDREFVEPELLDLIRRSDLILLVVDLQGFPIEQLEDAIAFLQQHHIAPHHLKTRFPDPQRMIFKPLLVAVNKNDNERTDGDFEVLCELLEEEWPLLPISATSGRHLENLKQAIFEQLEIIRVYSKPPGKEPDFSAPFVLPKGSILEEFAAKVHQDFVKSLKTARIWGSGVYDGQMVGRDHLLQDGDVVELRT